MVNENKIIFKKDIDVFASLECGQIFRYNVINPMIYDIYSKEKYCRVELIGDQYVLSTSDVKYFNSFFNMDFKYDDILKTFEQNKIFKGIITDDTPKIKIFKQDPFEMIISFIISANNNIPRIKGIVDKLCDGLGKVQPDGYKAFPEAEAMASQDVEYYKSIGLGYRAPYILLTAKKINDSFDIDAIDAMPTEEARIELMKLPGVGPKVADCILLFGYNRYDVFPVDTWIKKVYIDIFRHDAPEKQMRKDFLNMFGDYAGIAQQYLFYVKRSGFLA